MAEELFEATIQGDVVLLQKLIQQDPLILDRSIVTSQGETPLHVAAMLGHDGFCVELLRLKPGLARELDCRRSSPLHLAAAKGNIGVVKALVSIDPGMCTVGDKDGRNPVHVAAMKGRISVLKELIGVKPKAARALVNQDEGSVLHLCVEHCQFEALKLLLENVDLQEYVNCKDGNGNTVLHLAVADKQIQSVDYLLNHTTIEVNVMNAYGLTAMDMLFQNRRDKNDIIIAERLQNCGGKKSTVDAKHVFLTSPVQLPAVEKHDDWIERQSGALMVVASLIASMGFSASVTPPAGILALKKHPSRWSYYPRYLVYNTISFVSSISIILLLVSGVPFKRRLFMWIMMVIVWIAVTSAACTYAVTVEHHLEYELKLLGDLIMFGFLCWVVVMTIVLGFHLSRFYVMLVAKYRRRPSST